MCGFSLILTSTCVIFRLIVDKDDSPDGHRSVWQRVAAPLGVALLLVGLVAILALRWASDHALSVAHANAEQSARTHQGRLFSELQKYRLLPLVLIEYPDVTAVLEGSSEATVDRLNAKLELLSQRTNAAVIYVIGADGRTVAASNWRLPTSFVGQHYGFRPYFGDALREGAAELFALGTISNRPGLFIARRVGPPQRPLGVIVVKVEFDAVEAEWSQASGPTFVTDSNGVVIITSRPEWRFRTTRPVDPAVRARVRETVQYGREPLLPLGLAREGALARMDGKTAFAAAVAPTSMEGAHLHFLEPMQPALASARAGAWASILGSALLAVLLLALLLRAREQRALREQARRALERDVALRTAELAEANEQLTRESRQREIADRRYRAAREELAQANRLSSLGQIVAGVAHEINQPVAAIRSFADNGTKLLERQRFDEAKQNLGLISELTDRIGAITAELRSFTQRRTPAGGTVQVGTAIEGALLLIGDTLRGSGIAVERAGDQSLVVAGDRVRLEQILINLLQNAAEALRGRDQPRVRIEARERAGLVSVEVADNGGGVPPHLVDQLFTPFITGRDEGLGLGLAIARDIARDLGGELELAPAPSSGAVFRLTLRKG